MNKELIKQARQADLAHYLICKGYRLIKNGTRYRHPDHNSLVFTKNSYYWNSRSETGNSIDYLVKHLGYDFTTAVYELTKEKNIPGPPSVECFNIDNLKLTKNNYNRAFAYLNKTRYVDNNIITYLIDNNCLFMDDHNNIVFPIYDENNKIVGAELQGTLTYKKFKGISKNSKYGYGFNIRTSHQPKKAFFFESAIDLISFYQLCEYCFLENIDNSILISMAGLKPNIVKCTLKAFEIDFKPIFCVDNDEAGQAFINAFKSQNKAYEVYLPPDDYKDWNEYLISVEKK